MKLKEMVLAGAILLSSSIPSEDKLHFDIYSKGEGVFSPRLNTSSLKADSNELDFSFLFGIYSMEFKKINDSTYQEIAKTNFLWKSKEEIFDYSFKDSCYTLKKYSVTGNQSREEKKALEGLIFNKKYKSVPGLFNDFERGLLKDSIHFIVFGEPYSIKIESTKKYEDIVYSCNPKEIVKEEPGDFILFPYPLEVRAKIKDEKITPFRFSTKFLNAKTGRNTSIEGELREK
jgi:hypothetical protein